MNPRCKQGDNSCVHWFWRCSSPWRRLRPMFTPGPLQANGPGPSVTFPLTTVPVSVTPILYLAHVKGPAAEAYRGTGARAVPAGGIANRSRAAPGIS